MKKMVVAKSQINEDEVNFVVPAENVNAFIELLDDMESEYSVYEAGEMPFEKLPEDVQEKAKETLKMFNFVNVTYEYKEYEVSPHTCIRAHYNHDHFVCGRYSAKEIFTEEERKQHLKELNSYEFPEWAW